MRLWGGHGQKRLEEAKICCLGSGPTASECLKNLVLPNVGNFTVVDDAITAECDLGNNFFVDDAGLGKPRATVVCELLMEMNAGSKGTPKVVNPVEMIEKTPEFFKDFNIVVACNIPEQPLLKLSEICTKEKIPLVILSAFGLLGYARLQIKEQCVIESHYENDRYDLFVHPEQLKTFPELKAFIDGFGDLKDITDTMAHSHVPYVVILAKAMEAWIAEKGSAPSDYDANMAFKETIKGMSLKYEGDGAEENFHEAVNNARRAYLKPSLDWLTQAVLDDPVTKDMFPEAGNFWVIVCAVKRFIRIEGKGNLPCSVKIPDMTSTPESYVKLGNIYKTRAERDEGIVHKHAGDIMVELGFEEGDITLEEVSYIVKNLRGIRIVRTGSLVDEYDPKQFPLEDVNEIYDEWKPEPAADAPPNPRNINWYFAFRACQQFYTKKNRWPGTGTEEEVPEDAKELVELQTEHFKSIGLERKVEEVCCQAMARYGASEIHNIAAYIGGVGSQIVLKTIIQQYVPLNNTFIFNGTHGSGSVFKF